MKTLLNFNLYNYIVVLDSTATQQSLCTWSRQSWCRICCQSKSWSLRLRYIIALQLWWFKFYQYLLQSSWFKFCQYLLMSSWFKFCQYLLKSSWFKFCQDLLKSSWFKFCQYLLQSSWFKFCYYLLQSSWFKNCQYLFKFSFTLFSFLVQTLLPDLQLTFLNFYLTNCWLFIIDLSWCYVLVTTMLVQTPTSVKEFPITPLQVIST